MSKAIKALKAIKTDKRLLALIKAAVQTVKRMTAAERKAMHEAQAASWARQDMD